MSSLVGVLEQRGGRRGVAQAGVPDITSSILSAQATQGTATARTSTAAGSNLGRLAGLFKTERDLQELKDRIAGRRDPDRDRQRFRAGLSRGRRSTILGGSTGSSLQSKRLLGE